MSTEKAKAIDDLCQAVWDMSKQAPHDFVGEHRDFYLPLLQQSMVAAAILFPAQFGRAMSHDEQ